MLEMKAGQKYLVEVHGWIMGRNFNRTEIIKQLI